MILASDWRWPLTWKVRTGQPNPYHLLILWHFHCMLPRGEA